MDIVFREESSLLNILSECLTDSVERIIVFDALLFGKESEDLKLDKKLYAIYKLASMILQYEDFCEGGPMDLL